MNPLTIAQLGLGALGIFGRKKRDPYQEAMADQTRKKSAWMDEYMKMARAYDPAKEDQAGFDYANQAAAKNLELANANLRQRFANQGGTGGDTSFAIYSGHSANDVLDPLRALLMERKATQAARKLQAFEGALGMAGGGDVSRDYQALYQMNQANQQDQTGAFSLLSGGLNSLMQPKTRMPNTNTNAPAKEMNWNTKSALYPTMDESGNVLGVLNQINRGR